MGLRPCAIHSLIEPAQFGAAGANQQRGYSTSKCGFELAERVSAANFDQATEFTELYSSEE
ncbi:hypothetical protein SE91_30055 [Bradyrhizobium sp. DOA1]|nr:hypothetical protein SE91_30055 [Bradyrhizobium sp. DOA1]